MKLPHNFTRLAFAPFALIAAALWFAFAPSSAAQPTPPASQPVTATTSTGALVSPSNFFTGNYAAIRTAVALVASTPNSIVFEGDSMTANNGSGGIGTSNMWPQRFLGSLDRLSQVTNVNVATSGETANTMDSTYSSQVSPYKPVAPATAWLSVWGGTNDIATGRTATQVYGNLTSIWAKGRADGFKIIAFTIMPRLDLTAPQEAYRVSLNASILAASSLWDYCVDASTLFPDASNQYYFNGDGVHLTAAGMQTLANEVLRVIRGGASPRYDQLTDLSGSLTGAVTVTDNIVSGVSRLQNSTLKTTGTNTATGRLLVNNATSSSDITGGALNVNNFFNVNGSNGDIWTAGQLVSNAWAAYNTSIPLTLTAASGQSIVLTAVSSSGIAQAIVKAATSGNSSALEIKDNAATPNRWWIALGDASTTDGALLFYDIRQGKAGLKIDNSAFDVNAALGNFKTSTIGKTLAVKSGTNSLAGTVTLASGAGTISSTAIDANTVIVLTLKTVSGTVGGQPYVSAITAGTSATLAGGGASNNSTYNWVALKVN